MTVNVAQVCVLNKGTKRWFISHVPKGRDPGTREDVDYYWATPSEGPKPPVGAEINPPLIGWKTCADAGSLADEPAPVLKRIVIAGAAPPPAVDAAAPDAGAPAEGVDGFDDPSTDDGACVRVCR